MKMLALVVAALVSMAVLHGSAKPALPTGYCAGDESMWVMGSVSHAGNYGPMPINGLVLFQPGIKDGKPWCDTQLGERFISDEPSPNDLESQLASGH
jgi:hypothetical protein